MGVGRGGRGARRQAQRPQPYNRNKFLQANFRFLVSDAADLRRHEANADLMLDWDDIVEVGISLSSFRSVAHVVLQLAKYAKA